MYYARIIPTVSAFMIINRFIIFYNELFIIKDSIKIMLKI